MNVWIFGARATECMYAQTRPRFILSSERVLGNGARTYATSKGKKSSLPEPQRRDFFFFFFFFFCIRCDDRAKSSGRWLRAEEGRTRDAASRRTVSPTYYRLSYSGPRLRVQQPPHRPSTARRLTREPFAPTGA